MSYDRIPPQRKAVIEAERHLRNCLKNAAPIVTRTQSEQLPKMVAHFARMRLVKRDRECWPGMKKMAHWGNCSTRQAQANFKAWENCCVVVPVAFRQGGRGKATAWQIDYIGLKRWLVNVGANPSASLLERLRTVLNPEINREVLPEKKPEATSPRSIEISRRDFGVANVVPLQSERGRQ